MPSTWVKTGAFPVRAVYDDIAIDPDNPDRIYLVVENVGVVWTTDGGKSWRNAWCRTPHTMKSVVLDPLKPNLVHVASQNLCVADISEGRELKKISFQKDYDILFLTSHSDKVYAVTPEGIFWTSNQWESWSKLDGAGLPQGIPTKERPFTDLVFDPTNSNVIYVGGRHAGKDDTRPVIYKTTDGGRSWSAIANGLDKVEVWMLALDSANPLVLYLGGKGGLYRTKDGGASWHRLGLEGIPITSLYIDPADPTIIYAGSVADGLYRTDNDGVSWTNIRLSDFGTPSHFPQTHQNYVTAIAGSPKDPKTLYVTTGDGLFKITDGRSVSFVDVRLENGPGGGGSLRADGGLSDMMAAPSDPNVVYAIDRCGEDAYRSNDGGRTWIDIGASGAGWYAPIGSGLVARSELVTDHNYGMRIAVSPLDSREVWITTKAGAFKSSDGGRGWKYFPFTAPLGSFPGCAQCYKESNHVHAIALDPSTPGTVYLGTAYATREGASAAKFAAQSLAFDSGGYVFKTTDGGATWLETSMGIPTPADTSVYTMAVHPTNANIVYLGTSREDWNTGGDAVALGVYRSSDRGSSWAQAGLEGYDIFSLAVDLANPSIVYAGTNKGLYKTENGGGNWQLLWVGKAGQGDPKFGFWGRAVAVHPQDPNVVLAGFSDEGLYASTDAGRTWRLLNPELKNILSISIAGPYTYVATQDRGIYRGDLQGAS